MRRFSQAFGLGLAVIVMSVAVCGQAEGSSKLPQKKELSSIIFRGYYGWLLQDQTTARDRVFGGNITKEFYSTMFPYLKWRPLYGSLDLQLSGKNGYVNPAISFMTPLNSSIYAAYVNLGYKWAINKDEITGVGITVNTGFAWKQLFADFEVGLDPNLSLRSNQVLIKVGIWVDEPILYLGLKGLQKRI